MYNDSKNQTMDTAPVVQPQQEQDPNMFPQQTPEDGSGKVSPVVDADNAQGKRQQDLEVKNVDSGLLSLNGGSGHSNGGALPVGELDNNVGGDTHQPSAISTSQQSQSVVVVAAEDDDVLHISSPDRHQPKPLLKGAAQRNAVTVRPFVSLTMKEHTELPRPKWQTSSDDMISEGEMKKYHIERKISDLRSGDCTKRYSDVSVPAASLAAMQLSVVIIFCNEPKFNLIRTIHSVLNQTPFTVLQEIILVDDGSTDPYIVGDDSFLVQYVKQLPRVRVIRNPLRTGIVGARLLGVKAAIGPLFAILDSHVEVAPGWHVPLVTRIAEDPKRIVMPLVDSIDPKSLDLIGGGIGCVLGVLWRMIEHGIIVDPVKNPKRARASPADFLESPTMAGGIFAAHKDTFFNLGGYDEQITFWGAENLELSLRWWQCGGVIECSECSRVAHLFGAPRGYFSMSSASVLRNRLRTVAVWMDEFADLTWKLSGEPTQYLGSLEDRRALRRDLKCHNFKWFVENVWPESDVHAIPDDVPFEGVLRNVRTEMCFVPQTNPVLKGCNRQSRMIYFRRPGRITPIRDEESCLTLNSDADKPTITNCHEVRPTVQQFHVVEIDEGKILIKNHSRDRCLSPMISEMESQERAIRQQLEQQHVQKDEAVVRNTGAGISLYDSSLLHEIGVHFEACNHTDPAQWWLWPRYKMESRLPWDNDQTISSDPLTQ
eukprot:Lankesteria_metandrocarpae@DN7141_c0_g1_i1.p1